METGCIGQGGAGLLARRWWVGMHAVAVGKRIQSLHRGCGCGRQTSARRRAGRGKIQRGTEPAGDGFWNGSERKRRTVVVKRLRRPTNKPPRGKPAGSYIGEHLYQRRHQPCPSACNGRNLKTSRVTEVALPSEPLLRTVLLYSVPAILMGAGGVRGETLSALCECPQLQPSSNSP